MQINTVNLTVAQKAYLQKLLPHRYSLQVVTLEGKRSRSVKKLDDSFTDDFSLITKKTEVNTTPSHSQKCIEREREEQQRVSRRRQEQERERDRLERVMTKFYLRLKMHQSAWPFRMPVDPVSQGVPNYFEIIKQPMDLNTISKKIKAHFYSGLEEFDRDVRLIFGNSYTFNTKQTTYYVLTKELESYYEVLREEYARDPRLFSGEDKEKKNEEEMGRMETPRKKGNNGKRSSGNKGGRNGEEVKFVIEKPKHVMGNLPLKERKQILEGLQGLDQEGIKKLVQIMEDTGKVNGQWQQVEIELKDLNQDKFKKIEQLLLEQQRGA